MKIYLKTLKLSQILFCSLNLNELFKNYKDFENILLMNYVKFQVHVTVEDENDNPPKFTQTRYDIRVRENWKPDSPLLRLAVSDSDLNSNVWLSLKGKGNELFTLSQSGSLRLNRALDREERSVYTFSVTARDQGRI